MLTDTDPCNLRLRICETKRRKMRPDEQTDEEDARERLGGTPDGDVEISDRVIRSLLEEQHPDLSHHSFEIVDGGWDNVIARLGSDLAIRLPRRREADPLAKNEQLWLPSLAPQLPLPIPVPLRHGRPQRDYPYHWSIVRWLPGDSADLCPPNPSEGETLANFLRALHLPAPSNAPSNPARDVPLSDKAELTNERLTRLSSHPTVTESVRKAWRAVLHLKAPRQRRWIDGDLHARNVLVQDGRISAIIDWGDICGGDVATDLAAVWSLFGDQETRHQFFLDYDADRNTRLRAMGWAVFFGAVLLDTGLVSSPRQAALGETILRRVGSDAAAGWTL